MSEFIVGNKYRILSHRSLTGRIGEIIEITDANPIGIRFIRTRNPGRECCYGFDYIADHSITFEPIEEETTEYKHIEYGRRSDGAIGAIPDFPVYEVKEYVENGREAAVKAIEEWSVIGHTEQLDTDDLWRKIFRKEPKV